MSHVMFVDDEPRVLGGLRRVLWVQRLRWDLSFEESGPAALARMETRAPDVVVSDVRMPGMDGGALLREVRRRYPEAARIVLSGHTDERDLLGLVGLAHQFLVKPCAPEALEQALTGVIAARQSRPGGPLGVALSALGLLPARAAAVDKLEAVVNRPATTDRDVAAAVEEDVALSVKTLQLVNSSFFAPALRTASIGEAVRRLGVSTARGLVTELRRTVALPDAPPVDWLDELNVHALATARAARASAPPGRGDEAFCAGLLHSVGPLAVAASSGRTVRCSTAGPESELAGTYLLRLWGLPAEVISAAAEHLRRCPA